MVPGLFSIQVLLNALFKQLIVRLLAYKYLRLQCVYWRKKEYMYLCIMAFIATLRRRQMADFVEPDL